MTWAVALALGAGSYLLRLAGLAVPSQDSRGRIAEILDLLPGPLLAALIVVHTVGADNRVVLDARLPALAAAVVAIALRAPFFVVLVVGVATAAILRAVGWG
jgi:branched-subunit amino acid transport protein